MFKAIIQGAVILFFVLIGVGLWALFRNLNALAGSIALLFVIGGAFNAWSALKA